MIKRSTWIIFGVFLALVALAIFLNSRPEFGGGEATPTADLSLLTEVQPIFNLEEEKIIDVTITDSVGEEIGFSWNTEIGWTMIVSDTEQAVDAAVLENSISRLRSLTSDAELEESTDLGAVGLENPSYQITVGTDQGDTYQIDIGSTTITGGGYYVTVNDGRPQIVDKLTIDTFTGFLLDPPYQPTPTPEATQTLEPSPGDGEGEESTEP